MTVTSFNGKSIHRFVLLDDFHVHQIHFSHNYLLKIEQKWEIDGQSKTVHVKEAARNRNGKLQYNIDDLNPGTTFCVRLRVSGVGSDGEAPPPGKPCPELIIDTEAVS